MDAHRNKPLARVVAPLCAGRSPRFVAALLAALVSACANTDANQVTQPSVVGISDKLAALVDDGQTTIYQVAIPVTLPFRSPTEAEASGLKPADPLPHEPFLQAGDARVEIRFTLSNLDPPCEIPPQDPCGSHSVELLIDPWNEFVRYRPGLNTSEESTTPDFSGFDKFYTVPARSRVTGAVTSDDVTKLEIDLVMVQSILANPPTDPTANVNGLVNHIFNIQNPPNATDPLIAPHLPKGAVPGLTGFDLGLRSRRKGNVAVEVIVDVADLNGKRVIAPGDTAEPMGIPSTVLTPPRTAIKT